MSKLHRSTSGRAKCLQCIYNQNIILFKNCYCFKTWLVQIVPTFDNMQGNSSLFNAFYAHIYIDIKALISINLSFEFLKTVN